MEIAELKTRLSILEVAQHLGIAVDKQGKALCPFHDDKKPSLQFSQEKNICTCFSSNCDAGTMDIISLTEKYMKLTTHEAIMKLRALAGDHTTNGSTAQEMGKIALLTKVFRYFESSLFNNKTAKPYLQKRGLVPSSPARPGIEVGFNYGTYHVRMPEGSNKYFVESLERYGLLKTNKGNAGGFNVFGKNCLVFPLKNKQSQIVSLYFRSVNDETEHKHFYLKDREGLYPHYPKADTKQLILTEAIIDAATLLQIPDIVYESGILACYGTNGFTAEHEQAIKELNQLEEIIIFFDGDEAGKEGTKRIAEKLHEIRPEIKISYINTPENEDVNSLAQSHEPTIFKHLIKERILLFSIEKKSVEIKKSPEITTPVSVASPSVNTPSRSIFDKSNPNKITYITETAAYYIKGGLRKELDSMRVSLVIEHLQNLQKYRTKLDLYEAKQVERTANEAAEKLGLRADLIELDLNRLTDKLDEYRDNELNDQEQTTAPIILDESVTSKCKEFLSKPNLIKRINELIVQAGVVGEENNRIFLFVIASSYKMGDTLHALIQGSSGSGKTHLLKRVSNFMPQEDSKHFTRVTDSSLYNYGMYDLKNKLICLEDLDGMKEEAQLALRELQSREMLCSSTTGQDEKGNIRAFERIVYGPIASLACTTKGEIYEDNMSRCFVLAVDETKEQTLKIISYQNKKSAGQIDSKREQQITEFLQNCVRLLKPNEVVNPYADKVHLPEEAHKIRRLNELYQAFVKQITLINQYRRKRDQLGRLIAEKEDLQVAAEIMFDSIVLKIDELDGSLRLFYERLKAYVKAKGKDHYETYHFGQREIRQALNVSKSQLHRYLNDLTSLEYLRQTGGYANRGFTYKVLYWDNIQALRAKVKRHLQGQLDQLELSS